MRRIRTLLVAIAICLFIALAMLVSRALESIDFEREMRHRAVAERAFDEMERVLSRFLERQAERTYDEAGWLAGADAVAANPDFVLAYFQIDADGALRTRATAQAALQGAPLTSRIQQALEAIERRPARKAELQLAEERTDSRTLASAAIQQYKGAQQSATIQRAAEPGSAYDVLQKLNRATRERAEQSRYLDARAKKSKRDAGASYSSLSRNAIASFPRAEEVVAEHEGLRAESDSDAFESRTAASATRAPSPAGAASKAVQKDAPASPVVGREVEVGPLVGRSANGSELLLYRTVLIGREGYRQGVLIDIARLGRSLKRDVLDASGLSAMSRSRFVASRGAPATSAQGYVYQHRFEAPFSELHLVLDLDPLPDLAPASTIYGLALVAAFVLLIGFASIERMASVTLAFAQRRNDFVASVSHELKTPLTSIRMQAEMLRDGMVRTQEKRDEYYASITDESERLSRLIDNVLEFSRLERGTRALNLHEARLAPLIDEAVKRLTPHVLSEGFTLRVEIEDELPSVRVDRDALFQILFNLVDNALKYARAAVTREIEIRCQREGDGVRLEVRDHGPGVARAHRSRLFEPFYRGDPAQIQATGGAGIGLSLVKDLADAMGANVSIRTPDDGGFWIGIDFKVQTDPSDASAEESAP